MNISNNVVKCCDIYKIIYGTQDITVEGAAHEVMLWAKETMMPGRKKGDKI